MSSLSPHLGDTHGDCWPRGYLPWIGRDRRQIRGERVSKVKLNPNAQKWVDALRSGKYQQGAGCLSAEGKFCCLGVACEVMKAKTGSLAAMCSWD